MEGIPSGILLYRRKLGKYCIQILVSKIQEGRIGPMINANFSDSHVSFLRRHLYTQVGVVRPHTLRTYTQDERANRAPVRLADRRPDLPGEPGSKERIAYYRKLYEKGGEL